MTSRSKNIINAVSDYGKGLFNFIRGKVNTEADAEDILQDVWYQLSNIDDTDEIEQLRGWLFKVARNKIIDKSRRKTEELIEDLGYNPDNYQDDEEFNFADILLMGEDNPDSKYIKE